MARRDARIVCLDQNGDGATAVAEAIVAEGGAAFAERLDVTDRQSQGEVWASVLRKSGQLHAVVNCLRVSVQAFGKRRG
jgi:NAD(P)-dependent dehydrogenase (short-subunit alcohol dehydrogenase family)